MKEMSLRGSVAILLFLVCLSGVVFTAERKRKRQEGRGDGDPADNPFTTKDRVPCSWVARGEDTYVMTVKCKPENADEFTCKYAAKPATCDGYASNPLGYWKQITRSLKKQKQICSDPRALLRAGMCKRAPEAHFKLLETAPAKHTRTDQTPVAASTTLPCRADYSEIAREQCGDSWASFCMFLFTMIQSGDC